MRAARARQRRCRTLRAVRAAVAEEHVSPQVRSKNLAAKARRRSVAHLTAAEDQAQQKVERNLERKRKYDERVKAALEAQNIDPLREQEEKNERIQEKLDKAAALRKWHLYKELLDPEKADFGRPGGSKNGFPVSD